MLLRIPNYLEIATFDLLAKIGLISSEDRFINYKPDVVLSSYKSSAAHDRALAKPLQQSKKCYRMKCVGKAEKASFILQFKNKLPPKHNIFIVRSITIITAYIPL